MYFQIKHQKFGVQCSAFNPVWELKTFFPALVPFSSILRLQYTYFCMKSPRGHHFYGFAEARLCQPSDKRDVAKTRSREKQDARYLGKGRRALFASAFIRSLYITNAILKLTQKTRERNLR